jgi:1,4-dihydroxy-2-naphthoate octaprenyltransferase
MSDVSLVSPSRLGLWIRAARPRTLALSIAPIVVGAAHAGALHGRIAALPVAAATISALAIQIATNLANDAADGEKGLDGSARLGPPRVTGQRLMTAAEVRRGAIAATLVAILAGFVAVAAGGLPILLVGLASILAAWAYSAGPRPISATPFGEFFVIAYFGIAAVVGTEWLAVGMVDLSALGLGFAVGLPAAAVLTVNYHRDRDGDALNGRRTLAIVVGPRGAVGVYAVELLTAPLATAAVLAGEGRALWYLPLFAVPIAFRHVVRLAGMSIGRGLNGRLAATSGFQMLLVAAIVAALSAGVA